MAKKITLKNPQTGMIKQAYTGFSWTSLLFGAFPMAFRGDWKAFLIALIISLIAGAFTAGISSIVIGIVLGIKYNAWHARGLVENGYSVVLHADGMSPELAEQMIKGGA